jgi:hypothetical protein
MKGGIFNARKKSTCQKGAGQKASSQEGRSCEEGRRSCKKGRSCEEASQKEISG